MDLKVTMPKNNLAGTSWQLAPTGFMSVDPIHIVWNADEFPFGDNGTWDIQSALLMTMGMAPIKNGMTVPQLLFGILNEVTFCLMETSRPNIKILLPILNGKSRH